MYTSEELAKMAGGTLKGDGTKSISKLCTDSRALTLPEQTLFVAIKTSRGDGSLYIESLYKNNVKSFMVSDLKEEYKTMKDAAFIVVDDTLKALQEIAKKHREKSAARVVGITGSNGKTIVKEWLNQLLNED